MCVQRHIQVYRCKTIQLKLSMLQRWNCFLPLETAMMMPKSYQSSYLACLFIWCYVLLSFNNTPEQHFHVALFTLSTSMSVRHPPSVRLQPFPWSFRRTAWFFFSGAHRLSTVATGSNFPNLYLRTAVPIIPLVAGAFHQHCSNWVKSFGLAPASPLRDRHKGCLRMDDGSKHYVSSSRPALFCGNYDQLNGINYTLKLNLVTSFPK